MVVLGGLGNITGSVFSAIVLTLLPEFLRGFAEYRMVIYSVLLILMMLFRPEGIMGKNELSLEALESLVGRMKNRKGMRSDGTS